MQLLVWEMKDRRTAGSLVHCVTVNHSAIFTPCRNQIKWNWKFETFKNFCLFLLVFISNLASKYTVTVFYIMQDVMTSFAFRVASSLPRIVSTKRDDRIVISHQQYNNICNRLQSDQLSQHSFSTAACPPSNSSHLHACTVLLRQRVSSATSCVRLVCANVTSLLPQRSSATDVVVFIWFWCKRCSSFE